MGPVNYFVFGRFCSDLDCDSWYIVILKDSSRFGHL